MNEFWASNLVYEGLLRYGADGAIEPALATGYSSTVTAGKETFRFPIRQGVKFHDGAALSCAVVKLNFDHLWQPPLRNAANGHGWYDLPHVVESWTCEGETFVLVAKKPYYPLLQELTYIRPTTIMSPNAFADGMGTDPLTKNSCPKKWGTMSTQCESADSCANGVPDFPQGDGDAVVVTCVGPKLVGGDWNTGGTVSGAGTGPFKFDSRVLNDADPKTDDMVTFVKHTDYWDDANTGNVETIEVHRYDTAADVKAALLAGELDAVIGGGVLGGPDIVELS